MKTAFLIFVFITCLFWGCAHLDVVHDKIRDGETFFIALALGLFFLTIGIVGIGSWLGSNLVVFFLS